MAKREIKAGVRITGKDDSKSAFSGFAKSMQKAQNRVDRFKASFKGIGGGLKIAGGLMAGAAAGIGAAVAGVGLAIKKAVDETSTYADELGKFSRQTGFNVESLQELEYAARRNGLAVSDLRGGIVKMGKNLADLAAGTGQAKTALEKIDPVLLRQVKGAKSNAEAMDIWISRMGEIQDPAKRSAITFALFGRSGQKMLRLLDGGPKALAALREEMRKLGVLTEEDTKKAEAYKDAQEKMQTALSSLKRTLAIGFMPALTDAAAAMANFISENRPAILAATEILVKNIGETIKNFVDYLTANPTALQDFVSNAAAGLNSVVTAIKDVQTTMKDIEGFFGLGPDRRDVALERSGAGVTYGSAGQRAIKAAGEEIKKERSTWQKTTPLGFAVTAGQTAFAAAKAAIQGPQTEGTIKVVLAVPEELKGRVGVTAEGVPVSVQAENNFAASMGLL